MKRIWIVLLLLFVLSGCSRSHTAKKMGGETTASKVTSGQEAVMTSETTVIHQTTSNAANAILCNPFEEWFLSEVTYNNLGEKFRITVEPEHQTWVFQTPKQSTVRIHDIIFTVDFFKGTYHYGEGLQVRLTAMNTGTEAFQYMEYGLDCQIVPEGSGKPVSSVIFRQEHKAYYQDNIKFKNILPGESVIYEYFFPIEASGFQEPGKYTFICHTVRDCDWFTDPTKDYTVKIPLEVICN